MPTRASFNDIDFSKCIKDMLRGIGCLIFTLMFYGANAQICGTSGIDGPSNSPSPVNTFYPIAGDRTLAAGDKSILLDPVATDIYGNNFGDVPIRPGDLILIIQMQDAEINYENNANYGTGNNTSGADGLGGTGYTDIGFSGKFEYVIALNAVPLTGGELNFRGDGSGGGTVNVYVNADATGTRGQRRFQIVRVPQYSNLVLSSDITTVPYNGKAGGIIAFDVAGNMNFGGFKIDASEKGFRGGYGPNQGGDPLENKSNIYVIPSSDIRSVGKGEGIAGTPRYMFNGYEDFDSGVEGLPGGSFGKGAPANGGGGGNDHNAGGGGGGNGGQGGNGGRGWEGGGGSYPNGGRPGIEIPQDITRLIMGGGGGGGDANNATTGVKGGVGGGIVLINVEKITGTGVILANGGSGQPGAYGNAPDGAGGGGAGGTVFVRTLTNSAGASLTIEANGGQGGHTLNDDGNEHGPGGGGGGGFVYHHVPGATVIASVAKGLSGKSNNGVGIAHHAEDGMDGEVVFFSNDDLPSYLQGGGRICYPELTTLLTEANPGVPGSRNPGSTAVYTLVVANSPTGGNAGGVQTEIKLPEGFTITSVVASAEEGSNGPTNPIVSLVGGVYYIGTTTLAGAYNISPGGQVVFTINVDIAETVAAGMHHASAQVSYLDPTRTNDNPDRRITPKANAFAGANTTYETGDEGEVNGANYNGGQTNATGEDVHINAKPIPEEEEKTAIECQASITGTLTATDPDEHHPLSSLTFTLEGTYDTDKGTFVLDTDGKYTFTPSVRLFGTITINYRVTDPLGAYNIEVITFNQPDPLLDITETISHISAYGAADGAISVVTSGGVGTHSYSWLYPDGSTVTGSNISNLEPGSYTLTITDENDCTYSETYEIIEPPAITLPESVNVCFGEPTVMLPYTHPQLNPTSYSITWGSAAQLAGFVAITDEALPAVIPPQTSANIQITIPENTLAATYEGTLTVKNTLGHISGAIVFTIEINEKPPTKPIQLSN